jgi:calcineurin-like phosphoesterase family protein
MSVYFIGDLHLGHKGIMKFGQRKHPSIEEHDQALMDNWNNVVRRQKDLVWVLGDVAMDMDSLKLLPAFNGRKVLIIGNHDRFDTQVYLKYFERVISVEKRYHGPVMTHIPIHPNELAYSGWEFNVHGHVHVPEKFPYDPRYINVNADVIDLTPVSLDWLNNEMKERRIIINGEQEQDKGIGI